MYVPSGFEFREISCSVHDSAQETNKNSSAGHHQPLCSQIRFHHFYNVSKPFFPNSNCSIDAFVKMVSALLQAKPTKTYQFVFLNLCCLKCFFLTFTQFPPAFFEIRSAHVMRSHKWRLRFCKQNQ